MATNLANLSAELEYVDQPARDVIERNARDAHNRMANERRDELDRVLRRVDHICANFENFEAFGNGKTSVVQFVSGLAELEKIVSDPQTKKKYLDDVTIFVVGFENKCNSRLHLIEQVSEFLLENETLFDTDLSNTEAVDFEELNLSIESTIASVGDLNTKLGDLHRGVVEGLAAHYNSKGAQKQKKKLEKELESARKDLGDLSDRLLHLNTELQDRDLKAQQLAKQVENKNAELQKLRAAVEINKTAASQLAELQAELQKRTADFDTIKADLERVKLESGEERHRDKHEIELQQNKNKSLQTEIDNLKAQINDLQSQNRENQNAMLELRADAEARLARMKSKFKRDVASAQNHHNEETAKLQAELRKAYAEMNRTESEFDENKQTIFVPDDDEEQRVSRTQSEVDVMEFDTAIDLEDDAAWDSVPRSHRRGRFAQYRELARARLSQAAEQSRQQSDQKIFQLKSRFNDFKSQWDEESAALELSLREAERETEDAKRKAELAVRKLEELYERFRETQSLSSTDSGDLQTRIGQLQVDKTQLETRVEDLEHEVQVLHQLLKQAAKEKEDAEKKLSAALAAAPQHEVIPRAKFIPDPEIAEIQSDDGVNDIPFPQDTVFEAGNSSTQGTAQSRGQPAAKSSTVSPHQIQQQEQLLPQGKIRQQAQRQGLQPQLLSLKQQSQQKLQAPQKQPGGQVVKPQQRQQVVQQQQAPQQQLQQQQQQQQQQLNQQSLPFRLVEQQNGPQSSLEPISGQVRPLLLISRQHHRDSTPTLTSEHDNSSDAADLPSETPLLDDSMAAEILLVPEKPRRTLDTLSPIQQRQGLYTDEDLLLASRMEHRRLVQGEQPAAAYQPAAAAADAAAIQDGSVRPAFIECHQQQLQTPAAASLQLQQAQQLLPAGSLPSVTQTSAAISAPTLPSHATPPMPSRHMSLRRLEDFSKSDPAEGEEFNRPGLHLADHPIVGEFLRTYNHIMKSKTRLSELLSEHENYKEVASNLQTMGEVGLQLDRDTRITPQIEDLGRNLTFVSDQIFLLVENVILTIESHRQAQQRQPVLLNTEPAVNATAAAAAAAASKEKHEELLKQIEELKDKYISVEQMLQEKEQKFQAEVGERGLEIQSLQLSVTQLRAEVERLKAEQQVDLHNSLMFTKLDAERNTKTLKRALASRRIGEAAYETALEAMEEYSSVPARRMLAMSRQLMRSQMMSQLQSAIETELAPDRARLVLSRLQEFEGRAGRRYEQIMDHLREERLRLARGLVDTFEDVGESCSIFLIKPVLSLRHRDNLEQHLRTVMERNRRVAAQRLAEEELSSHRRAQLDDAQRSARLSPCPEESDDRLPEIAGRGLKQDSCLSDVWNIQASTDMRMLPPGFDRSLLNTPRLLEMDVNKILLGQNRISASLDLGKDGLSGGEVGGNSGSLRYYVPLKRRSLDNCSATMHELGGPPPTTPAGKKPARVSTAPLPPIKARMQ